MCLHLTQCRWAEAYHYPKWHLDPSNRDRHDRADNGPIALGEPFYTRSLESFNGTLTKRKADMREILS